MKNCIDCANLRTKKVYTQDDKYRIGYCKVFGKDLDYTEDSKIYEQAETCLGYKKE